MENPKTVDEALKLIKNALNKACVHGTYTLDEAYVIKIAVATVEKAVKNNESNSQP